jgi:outer membrane protein insertion porin family
MRAAPLSALALLLVFALAFATSCASSEESESAEEQLVMVPLSFEGANALAASDLEVAARHELKSYARKRRYADLSDAAFAMIRRLRAEGYPEAEVTAEVQPEGADGEAVESVLFRVVEGPSCRVETVSIEAPGLPDGLNLRRFVEGLEGEVYRKSALRAAASEIEAAALLVGYHDVLIEDIDEGLSEDGSVANPKITVNLGEIWHMEFAPWPADLKELLGDDLEALIDDDPIYHVRRPAEIAARVRGLLRERGYHAATVRYDTELDEEADLARVTISTELGAPHRLREIQIEGLDRTSRSFVVDVLDLEENEVLAQSEIDAALDRLHQTAIFDRIDLKIRQIEDEVAAGELVPADLDFDLREAEARSVEFFGGFGTYELARAGVQYRDRNLFGTGRTFDAQLRGSVRSARFEMGVTDPYTIGRPNVLRATVGAEYRVEPTFTRRALDAQFSLRHDFDARRSVSGGYRFLFTSVTDIEAELPDDVGNAGSSREAGLFVTYRDDQRDDAILPTEGYVFNAGVFWSTSALLADLDFLQLSASIFDHHQLWEGGVLAFGARIATRQPLGATEDLPLQQRYFLGGENTVRSFFESELGPTDGEGDPIGGLSSLDAHVEFRQKLVGDLHGALFYDVGTIGLDAFDFGGPFGQAIGLGLRYYLPIGPMRLDFGYNPGRRFAADSGFAIHFGFGFSF